MLEIHRILRPIDFSHASRAASGAAYRQIVEMTIEEEADLIVMGVGRRGIIDRVFVGSTTNQVVRRAECPVLTVRK